MRNRLARAFVLVVGLAAEPSICAAVEAGNPYKVAPEATCFHQLVYGTSEELVCQHPVWMTDEERADVKRLTREYLLDAHCLASVKIARSKVDAALVASDTEFISPPQPVVCEVVTSSGHMPIKATFSPRVVFKGGFAVSATPGLGDVEGINKYLAWPVIQYVNRADRIETAMLAMINAYRTYRAKAQETADGKPAR